VQKALDALLDAWFKAGGSAEEAVEVMTATAKGLRRKHADRRPWADACYAEGDYRIGLGRCPRGPQLRFQRSECDRLRHTLERALRRRQYRTVEITPHDDLWMTADLSAGVLAFSAVRAGVDAVFRLTRRRCRELIGLLAPANLDRLQREYEEEMNGFAGRSKQVAAQATGGGRGNREGRGREATLNAGRLRCCSRNVTRPPPFCVPGTKMARGNGNKETLIRAEWNRASTRTASPGATRRMKPGSSTAARPPRA
jgi:hypothetical protein